MFDIQYELSLVPALPGIYIMKDKNGLVIYVGKAKLLKNRLRQYFTLNKTNTGKVRFMVSQIVTFEYIITSSETEALILERNLIKKHRPKFNVLLKDDKNYPLIKITLYEEYPRVLMTRKVEKDGAKYFGPYTNAALVRETLEYLSRIYPLRSCAKVFPRDLYKQRPCINYQMGKCLAPCQEWVSREEYNKIIKSVCAVLDGKTENIVSGFENKMKQYAKMLEFEKAKEYRDRINAINSIVKRQNVSLTLAQNGDFISSYGNDKKMCVQVFYLRGSNITGRSSHTIRIQLDKTEGEIISEFISQFYDRTKIIPSNIYVKDIGDERQSIEEYLSRQAGHKVRIIKPQKGEKKKIIELVTDNARVEYMKSQRDQGKNEMSFQDALLSLGQYLMLDPIEYIEAVDISNTAKHDYVAAITALDINGFDKKKYRRYMIKGDYGINDYMSMAEVIKRRLARKEDKLPDMLLVDGGAGHVSTIRRILDENCSDIIVAGMVKDDNHKTRGIYFDNEFFDIRGEPLIFKLITLIQEETHRFALKYNKDKRKKRLLSSELDDIPGVGDARKKLLIDKFGSVREIKKAEIDEIARLPGISHKLAQTIKQILG